jgi:hypothetical protein
VVEVQAPIARMNEQWMNRKSECDTTARPCKCSGRAPLKRGADAIEAGPGADIASRTSRKWKRGRTFRLFGDEQPLEGSNVTCLERYLHCYNQHMERFQ